MTEQGAESRTRVECPAAKDPAVRSFIISGILIAFGVWCFVEAYVMNKYPLGEGFNQKLNYYFNHIGGIAFPLVGLFPLVYGVVFLRRRLVADEAGIGYQGRETIPWPSVKTLDTRQARKGIIKLIYEVGGARKVLVLDSMKLQNFRDLALLVEKKTTGAERI